MPTPTTDSGLLISLVIPAYNEEEAIVGTLQRATAVARNTASFPAGIRGVEVIAVSDGSRDRTVELAKSVPGVRLVHYEKNRGYGKAIETGYAVASGELLAFMDADGTCDPAFIFDLFREMQRSGADVVLGSRLHANSRMPAIRRVGNTLYAVLLSAISGQNIRDTASGMRLLKRALLPRILPLPSGLSYTPAMSARCILDPGIVIREIPMPYEERQGESKLNVLRDGFVFLHVILVTALFYTPLRMFGSFALLAAGAAFLAEGLVAHAAFHLAAVLSGIGLLFHFFSKKVLPAFPTSALQRAIDTVFGIPVLAAGGCAALAAAYLPWTPVGPVPIRELMITGGSLWLMLAAGRFIIRQMDAWQNRELDTAHLLAGAEIIQTG
jgi:hypothetical protein